jgi:hypothetical protein
MDCRPGPFETFWKHTRTYLIMIGAVSFLSLLGAAYALLEKRQISTQQAVPTESRNGLERNLESLIRKNSAPATP